jgi:hypothetical protein
MYSHEDRMTGPEKSVSLLARVSDVLIHAWIADSSEIVEFCRIAENECISPETPPRLLFCLSSARHPYDPSPLQMPFGWSMNRFESPHTGTR